MHGQQNIKIKWLVCVTEMGCVYCEVRSVSFIVIQVKSYMQVVKKFGRRSEKNSAICL